MQMIIRLYRMSDRMTEIQYLTQSLFLFVLFNYGFFYH